MGPAKVDTRPPEFFLKSHEKEPVYNQSQYWSLYHSDYYLIYYLMISYQCYFSSENNYSSYFYSILSF